MEGCELKTERTAASRSIEHEKLEGSGIPSRGDTQKSLHHFVRAALLLWDLWVHLGMMAEHSDLSKDPCPALTLHFQEKSKIVCVNSIDLSFTQ